MDLKAVEAVADCLIRKWGPMVSDERSALGDSREASAGVVDALLSLAASVALASVRCPDVNAIEAIDHGAREAREALLAAQRTYVARLN